MLHLKLNVYGPNMWQPQHLYYELTAYIPCLWCGQGAHAAETPDVPGPAPTPEPTTTPVLHPGPPKRPEWSAAAPAPDGAPASKQPGFDYLAQKRWNIVTGGSLPYNGSEPVRCPLAYVQMK